MELLEALGRALRGQAQWRSSYHQRFVPSGMTQGEESNGVVWISWPDRALFRAGDPLVRIMGLNDRQIRLVDLELSSCDDHLLSDDEWSRIPLAAVLDPRVAVDRFTVLPLGERGFALEPRQPGGVARVEVGLTRGDLPKLVLIIDPQGATNRLDFGDWVAVPSAPEGGWLPEPPVGVECISDADD
ncbi:MAG: hypothetical protein KJN73_03975 [Acidimicrobiia bacterium]|nr:hypothetical protein [Acidimicrobiia bacterium]